MTYKKPTYNKEEHKKETYVKSKPYEKSEYGPYTTLQQILSMFEIDVETGIVTYGGQEPSINEEGYAYFQVEGFERLFFCHKLVWMKANNSFTPFKREIHHSDHQKLNNKISNLQCLTHGEHQKIHGRKFPRIHRS